ncbi:MAG: hypothetical protein EP340_06900 [Alphaproteobacteria bacterium]|nr:MAG: hypothetical protein EP340_06900 [Alphaproteobacteria bacterium]
MSIAENDFSQDFYNPIDDFERLVGAHDWPFQRSNDDEIDLTLVGTWCDYHVSIAWSSEYEALHLNTTLDIKIGEEKMAEVRALLSLINEQLYYGHFDIWSEERLLLFRIGLPLNGGAIATPEQCERLLQASIEACERFYPAFQFVLWAGKSADEAVSAAMFETVGSA